MEERYFAASNSGKGFISYFDQVFSCKNFEHVYIIKGGPGTGKNFFMRSIACAAEEKGKNVVYYYCSSDQNSLDGIIVDGRIAVLDGTSPHTRDAGLPGAAEDIVDLGAFWNVKKLSEKRGEIEKLNLEKKRHYSRAYRYLAAYHEISRAIEDTVYPLTDRDKIRKSIDAVLKDVKNGKEYSSRVAICDSVGMEGRVRFDSLEKKAKKIYRIVDIFDTAFLYLSEIANAAMLKNLSVVYSYDPVNTDRLDAVFLSDSGILFTLCEAEGAKQISMSRFLAQKAMQSIRKTVKSSQKLRTLMLDETLLALSDVKKTHFKLEEIYKDAMDFEAKERFTKDFILGLSL